MLPDSVRVHQCLRSESHYVRLPCLFLALESVLPVRERAETDGDEVLVNSYRRLITIGTADNGRCCLSQQPGDLIRKAKKNPRTYI